LLCKWLIRFRQLSLKVCMFPFLGLNKDSLASAELSWAEACQAYNLKLNLGTSKAQIYKMYREGNFPWRQCLKSRSAAPRKAQKLSDLINDRPHLNRWRCVVQRVREVTRTTSCIQGKFPGINWLYYSSTGQRLRPQHIHFKMWVTSAFQNYSVNTTDHHRMLWIMYDLGFPTNAMNAVNNLHKMPPHKADCHLGDTRIDFHWKRKHPRRHTLSLPLAPNDLSLNLTCGLWARIATLKQPDAEANQAYNYDQHNKARAQGACVHAHSTTRSWRLSGLEGSALSSAAQYPCRLASVVLNCLYLDAISRQKWTPY